MVDDYPTARTYWDHLATKYFEINPISVNENLIAIQSFDFDNYGSIMPASDKLEEFWPKPRAANPEIRTARTDSALLLALISSLLIEYIITLDR